MTNASLALLVLAAAYLAALGLAVLAKPRLARTFLSAFAQSHRANLVEAGLRFAVGLAFVGASGRTQEPLIAVVVGLFLALTALLMLLLPGHHRRFASHATASLAGFFPLFGVASLALAGLLLWFISGQDAIR